MEEPYGYTVVEEESMDTPESAVRIERRPYRYTL